MGKQKYEPINTAREDQKTITFVCSDCGCLVRSDFTDAHDKKCKSIPKKGDSTVSNMSKKVLELVEDKKKSAPSPTSVWRFPESGKNYILAADPCVGNEGGSNAAIEVIDAETGEQCAEFASIVSPEEFAPIILYIAKIYNNAEVAVETNNIGLITNNILIKQGYENIYRHKRFDGINHVLTDLYGWWTNSKTRIEMESVLREEVINNTEMLRSEKLIDEILDYDENGSGNDDCFSAMMIAQIVRHERLSSVAK